MGCTLLLPDLTWSPNTIWTGQQVTPSRSAQPIGAALGFLRDGSQEVLL